jgi:WD40 repeat protein
MKIQQLDKIDLPQKVKKNIAKNVAAPTNRGTFHAPAANTAIPIQLQTDAFSMRDRTCSYPTRPSYIPPIHETSEARSMRERRDGLRDLNPSLVKAEQEQIQARSRSMSTKDDVFDVSATKLKQDESIAMRVMMQMNEETLGKLQAAFKLHHDAVDVIRFVELMLEHLDGHGQDEEDLTRMFCELFTQIDIGATETLSWDDFTSYVVGAASGSADNEAGTLTSDIQTYIPSRSVDQSKHTNGIEQVFYFSEIDRLVCCEQKQHSFKLYHPKSLHLDREVFGHRGCVMGADLLSSRHYLATASNDLTIGFWDTKHYQLRQRIPTSTVQVGVHWCQHYERLFSGGVDGSITGWDIDELEVSVHMPGSTSTSSSSFMRTALLGHSDTVMQLHSIAQQDVLASASLDTTIRLWDLHSGRLRKTLQGHSKGVTALAYSPHARVLASVGFDHDAIIWNPHVENMVCRLQGHKAALVGVALSEYSPQIVTADQDSMVKIWDMRTYRCVQTIHDARNAAGGATAMGLQLTKPHDPHRASGSSAEPLLTSLACCQRDQKFVVASPHRLFAFNTDEPADPQLADEEPVMKLLFNRSSLSFVTASAKRVKVWDATMGRLLQVYRHPQLVGSATGDAVQAPRNSSGAEPRKEDKVKEISAICLDGRQRVLVIGDYAGKIVTCNYLNGERLHSFQSHLAEVTALEYVYVNDVHAADDASGGAVGRIISAGLDGIVRVHDDSVGLSWSAKNRHVTLFTLDHVGTVRPQLKFGFNPLQFDLNGSGDDKDEQKEQGGKLAEWKSAEEQEAVKEGERLAKKAAKKARVDAQRAQCASLSAGGRGGPKEIGKFSNRGGRSSIRARGALQNRERGGRCGSSAAVLSKSPPMAAPTLSAAESSLSALLAANAAKRASGADTEATPTMGLAGAGIGAILLAVAPGLNMVASAAPHSIVLMEYTTGALVTFFKEDHFKGKPSDSAAVELRGNALTDTTTAIKWIHTGPEPDAMPGRPEGQGSEGQWVLATADASGKVTLWRLHGRDETRSVLRQPIATSGAVTAGAATAAKYDKDEGDGLSYVRLEPFLVVPVSGIIHISRGVASQYSLMKVGDVWEAASHPPMAMAEAALAATKSSAGIEGGKPAVLIEGGKPAVLSSLAWVPSSTSAGSSNIHRRDGTLVVGDETGQLSYWAVEGLRRGHGAHHGTGVVTQEQEQNIDAVNTAMDTDEAQRIGETAAQEPHFESCGLSHSSGGLAPSRPPMLTLERVCKAHNGNITHVHTLHTAEFNRGGAVVVSSAFDMCVRFWKVQDASSLGSLCQGKVEEQTQKKGQGQGTVAVGAVVVDQPVLPWRMVVDATHSQYQELRHAQQVLGSLHFLHDHHLKPEEKEDNLAPHEKEQLHSLPKLQRRMSKADMRNFPLDGAGMLHNLAEDNHTDVISSELRQLAHQPHPPLASTQIPKTFRRRFHSLSGDGPRGDWKQQLAQQ